MREGREEGGREKGRKVTNRQYVKAATYFQHRPKTTVQHKTGQNHRRTQAGAYHLRAQPFQLQLSHINIGNDGA